MYGSITGTPEEHEVSGVIEGEPEEFQRDSGEREEFHSNEEVKEDGEEITGSMSGSAEKHEDSGEIEIEVEEDEDHPSEEVGEYEGEGEDHPSEEEEGDGDEEISVFSMFY